MTQRSSIHTNMLHLVHLHLIICFHNKVGEHHLLCQIDSLSYSHELCMSSINETPQFSFIAAITCPSSSRTVMPVPTEPIFLSNGTLNQPAKGYSHRCCWATLSVGLALLPVIADWNLERYAKTKLTFSWECVYFS